MSDVPDTPAEKAEAAAIRRRWVTLGEIVAIAGLIISALALWSSWAERRADETERRSEKASEAKARAAILLTATPEAGGKRLVVKDAAHSLQAISIAFPTALGVGPRTISLDPVIDGKWIADPLLKLTDKGPDTREGRLPVLITADYWDGDRHLSDTAVYDLVWRTEGRLIEGRAFRLKGLMLHQRKGATQAAIDARWSAIGPR
ncbi:MAG: hypothetical protein B7Y45_05505 [Sphingomonas sp. 28-66-16]|nr:MAG: hypothetical protein B7Y45_05505 [Sphingomonas sp. 28-66-16]